MGLLSWFNNKDDKKDNPEPAAVQPAVESSDVTTGMNGAMEVRRFDPPVDVTVLQFGRADKETLAGYCPVSNKIEPCIWKILPARGDDPPKTRIVF